MGRNRSANDKWNFDRKLSLQEVRHASLETSGIRIYVCVDVIFRMDVCG
jgi:hypothetical protein